ncbi:MAG: ATP-grasp domain-containing protein [Zavarzinella sp.]
MIQQLVIVGASIRAAVQSARNAGIQAIGADLFTDADCLAMNAGIVRLGFSDYPHGFLAILRGYVGIPWLYSGGLENYADLIADACITNQLLGCQHPEQFRDPFLLQQQLLPYNVSFPEMSHSFPASGGENWLFKKYHSSGGLGIVSANSSHGESGYYQKLLTGQVRSAAFLASKVMVNLLGVFQLYHQQTPDLPFLYAGNIGPVALSSIESDFLDIIRQFIVEKSGLRGLFGVDYVIHEQQCYLLEVNPRYTASMELWDAWSGKSAVGYHVQACLGKHVVPPSAKGNESLFAKKIIYAITPLKVTRQMQQSLPWWIDRKEDHAGQIHLADIPQVGTVIEPGQPVCSVLFQAKDEAEAETRFHDFVLDW